MSTTTPTIYTGPSGGLKKESQWLASEDIGSRDVTVTIEAVEKYTGAEFEGGRKENVGALKFAGKEKRLILNSTNRRALVRLYGMETKDWIGKPVTLHVAKLKRTFGEREFGLRIRTEPGRVQRAEDGGQKTVDGGRRTEA